MVAFFCLFLLFVLSFVFLLLVDSFLFLFFVSSMSLSAWRRCPLLATFLSVVFCLCPYFSPNVFRFDLVWFRLSCDHGWIRSR